MLLSNPSAGLMRVFDPYVHDLIHGKSLLVLGSAPSVINLTPDFMESFDLIARVNNFTWFNPCKRVDIWYTMAGGSIRKSIGELNDSGCKLCFLKNPFDHIVGFDKLTSIDFRNTYIRQRRHWFEHPWYIQKKENWIWLVNQIGQIVTTGLSAIVDLYRFGPSRMHLAGFDFFSSMRHNIDIPVHLKQWPKHHDFFAEMLFCRQFVRQFSDITVDDTLAKIFTEPTKFPKIGSKPHAVTVG
jgi:hypothetical protein